MEELRKHLVEILNKNRDTVNKKHITMCKEDIMYHIGIIDSCSEIINYIDNIKNK